MKVSTFKPNLPDKVANVLAGTVTMTLRAYMDERGHFLQLRKNENVFGGGRIDFKRDRCDLTVEAFNAALLEAQGTKAEAEKPKARKKAEPKPEAEVEAETDVIEEPDAAEEKPKRRARKAKPVAEEEPPFDTEETAEPEAVEEKPKRRTRKRRTTDAE